MIHRHIVRFAWCIFRLHRIVLPVPAVVHHLGIVTLMAHCAVQFVDVDRECGRIRRPGADGETPPEIVDPGAERDLIERDRNIRRGQ
ncbi:MAG: hypothetical protein M3176_03970 [Chloroflexota bacterium]|nr:hypothetical protein [Chloroflexota bacterium]